MVKNHVEDSGLWDITRSCSCQDECRMTSICDPVLAQQTCFLAVFWINFADNSRWVPCFPLPFGPTIEEKPHCQGGRVKSGLVFSEKKHFVQTNVLRKWSIKSNWNKNKYLFVVVWIAKCCRVFFIVGFEFQALVERANHLRRIPKHACVFQHEQILANADKPTYHQSTHGRFMIGFTTIWKSMSFFVVNILQQIRFNSFAFGNLESTNHQKKELWRLVESSLVQDVILQYVLFVIACEIQNLYKWFGGTNASNECRCIVATLTTCDLRTSPTCGGAHPCTLTPPYDLKFSKTICRIISRGTGPCQQWWWGSDFWKLRFGKGAHRWGAK